MKDLNNLPVGQSIVIEGREGWKIKLTRKDSGFDITHYNPVGDKEGEGNVRFFKYTTVGDNYGAGKIIQEPTLGVPTPSDIGDEGYIVGAIVLDNSGKVTKRFSWSNLVFIQGKDFCIKSDHELIVNGERQGYIAALFSPDKNRMKGLVAVITPEKRERVKVLEMETLLSEAVGGKKE